MGNRWLWLVGVVALGLLGLYGYRAMIADDEDQTIYSVYDSVSKTTEFKKIRRKFREEPTDLLKQLFTTNQTKFSLQWCSDLPRDMLGGCRPSLGTFLGSVPLLGSELPQGAKPELREAYDEARGFLHAIGRGVFEFVQPIEKHNVIAQLPRYGALQKHCAGKSTVSHYDENLDAAVRLTFGLRGIERVVDYDWPSMLLDDPRRRATENFALWELSLAGRSNVYVFRAEGFQPRELDNVRSPTFSVFQNGMLSVFVGKSCTFLDQIPYGRRAIGGVDGVRGIEPGHHLAEVLLVEGQYLLLTLRAVGARPTRGRLAVVFALVYVSDLFDKTTRVIAGSSILDESIFQ